MARYNRLNAYEKQDGLVRKFGDLPSLRKPGDGGMDGDMAFRLGMDEGGLMYSVQTGKQRTPAHVRERKGQVLRALQLLPNSHEYESYTSNGGWLDR